MNIIINTSNKELQHKEEAGNGFSEFSGMWKDRDITQGSIRERGLEMIVLDAPLFTDNLKDFRFIDGLKLV